MIEVEHRAREIIPDDDLRTYFINKAKEILEVAE
jgi:hypothetical protein